MNRKKGYWSILPLPQIHEIMGEAGMEFAIIDLEHGTYSFQEALVASIAIREAGMEVGIRPSNHDPKQILRCLEIGVDHIFIPHVNSADEAKSAINACKYPSNSYPTGQRGASGFTRSTRYGAINFYEHTIQQNQNLHIHLLIESIEGLQQLNTIAMLEGLDGIYFGTYDIANTLGIQDQSSKEVRDLVKRKIDIIETSVKFIGQVAVDSEQFYKLDPRINLTPLGVDCGILLNGVERLLEDCQ